MLTWGPWDVCWASSRARPVWATWVLALNIAEVPLERALREEDGFGDFLVAEARLQALEDRDLATGELFAQAGPGGASLIAGLAPCLLQPARERYRRR